MAAENEKLIQLRVPAEVHQALKVAAAAGGTTMRELVLGYIYQAINEGKTA